jgi:hypothetical protein
MMKRRDFVAFAATATALLAAPVMAKTARPDLMRSPAACVGMRFSLENGQVVELLQANRIGTDPRCEQWQLQFSTPADLAEGTYVLHGARTDETMLYLQACESHMLACTNRLI